MLVLISIAMMMIQPHVMNQQMKTSKGKRVCGKGKEGFFHVDMELVVQVKSRQKQIMACVELVLPIMLESEVFECWMVM